VNEAKGYLDNERFQGDFDGLKPAIVLDVDDTTLNTYSYEIYSNFVYNPTTNAAFVNAGVFPAVFYMPQLVERAIRDRFTVFYLTGRPESQRAGTVANLVNAGYPAPDSAHLFMRNKDASAPPYLPCDATPPYCTTSQYKSMTREHIESLGYQIVANFGDQYSDLIGGYANRTFKLPNPMYYLP
jgi:predicted secreted acid phosphatase